MPRINGTPKTHVSARINAQLHARAQRVIDTGAIDWTTLIAEGLRKVLPAYERQGGKGVPPTPKSAQDGGGGMGSTLSDSDEKSSTF